MSATSRSLFSVRRQADCCHKLKVFLTNFISITKKARSVTTEVQPDAAYKPLLENSLLRGQRFNPEMPSLNTSIGVSSCLCFISSYRAHYEQKHYEVTRVSDAYNIFIR